jgi:hypothetical protein
MPLTDSEKQDAARTIESLCSIVKTLAECVRQLSDRLDGLEAALEAALAPDDPPELIHPLN